MSKLTLSIDENVIEKAKLFAKKSRRSLSEIVESYLDKITKSDSPETDEELDKILGILEVPDSFDEKLEIRKILIEKHSK